MAFWVYLRWFAFATYISFFFLFPLGLLWELSGFILGFILTVIILTIMGWNACERIRKMLSANILTEAQAPILKNIVREHCRRLNIPLPKIAVIETQSINFAVFGFTRGNAYLILTRGSLDKLTREQLSAVIAREITRLWHREIFCATWLCQFFALLNVFASSKSRRGGSHGRYRTHSFKTFLRQVFFYPLALFPALVLGRNTEPETIDFLSAKISRKPRELAESLRLMEALSERFPFQAPFSTRHLFLLTPQTTDPIVRVLFRTEPFSKRIKGMEQLSHLTVLS